MDEFRFGDSEGILEFLVGTAHAIIADHRLKENKTALRVLGVETGSLHGDLLYKFEPSPEQMERCRDAWNDSAPTRYQGDDALGVPEANDVL